MSLPVAHYQFPHARAEAARVVGEQNFSRLWRRTTRALSIALGVPLLVLLMLTVFLFQSSKWVDHTDEVIAEARVP